MKNLTFAVVAAMAACGWTVQAAIVNHRLKAACEKLRGTRLSVSRIAVLCGFSSANRLTPVFTARYGMSPRAYRASAAQRTRTHSQAR